MNYPMNPDTMISLVRQHQRDLLQDATDRRRGILARLRRRSS